MNNSLLKDNIEFSLPAHENRLIGAFRNNFVGENDNFLYTFYGLIKLREFFNPAMNKHKNLIRHLQTLDSNQLERIQKYKLMKILIHSYNTVPYYNKLMKSLGITYSHIKNGEVLSILPILSKDIVHKEPNSLCSGEASTFSPILSHTGGTTGRQLNFFIDKSHRFKRLAEKFLHWENYGYKFRDKMVVLRGRTLSYSQNSRPWKYDYVQNILYLSSYHLTEKNMVDYYDLIRDWKPKYIQAYPSSAYILSKYLMDNNLSLNTDFIFTSSENLLPHMKESIESSFNCKVVDHYGHSEPGVWITSKCICGSYLVNPISSIVQVRKENGEILDEGVGNLVETCLDNYSMPFLKYNIGDIVKLSKASCSTFSHIERIDGRKGDFLKFGSRLVSGPMLHNQVSKNLENIESFQIVQENPEVLIINIVPSPNYSSDDEIRLIEEVRDRIGKKIKIDTKICTVIPRTKSGKVRFVLSKLK